MQDYKRGSNFAPSEHMIASFLVMLTWHFALKFTDNANPNDLGIAPLDSVTPQTFLVTTTDVTPISMTPIFVNVPGLAPLPQLPPSGGNNRFRLNIPPELVTSDNRFTEQPGTGNAAPGTVVFAGFPSV